MPTRGVPGPLPGRECWLDWPVCGAHTSIRRTGVKEDKSEHRWTDPGDPLDEVLTLLAEAWSTRYRTQNQSL